MYNTLLLHSYRDCIRCIGKSNDKIPFLRKDALKGIICENEAGINIVKSCTSNCYVKLSVKYISNIKLTSYLDLKSEQVFFI